MLLLNLIRLVDISLGNMTLGEQAHMLLRGFKLIWRDVSLISWLVDEVENIERS